jgi:hypothetical protein
MDKAVNTQDNDKDESSVLFIKKTKLKNVKVRIGLAPELNPLKNLFITVLIPELEVIEDSATAYDLRKPGKLLFNVLKTVILSCLYTARDVTGAEEIYRFGIEGLKGLGSHVNAVSLGALSKLLDGMSLVGGSVEGDSGDWISRVLLVTVLVVLLRSAQESS